MGKEGNTDTDIEDSTDMTLRDFNEDSEMTLKDLLGKLWCMILNSDELVGRKN